MQIDLMISRDGEAGLVSDAEFEQDISGVIFEIEEGKLFVEYADMSNIELNIAVSPDFSAILEDLDNIYIGVVEGNVITMAREVPLGIVE